MNPSRQIEPVTPLPNAGSGDMAGNVTRPADVGRVPPPGVPIPPSNDPLPRRLRRLHRLWPDRDGNISYLLTICVEGRARVLDNEDIFQQLVAFLLDSPVRYRWFGRRFVVMPDHLYLIAHMGHDAIRLGQWIKALKAVVGGLKPRADRPVGAPGLQNIPSNAGSGDPACNVTRPADVGRVPPPGVPVTRHIEHTFTRIQHTWSWQDGFHDHKFRTPESESRKWEYVCLNPVRYGLVQRPEAWPFGGEIFYGEAGGPKWVHGTPSLLETGMLIEQETPGEGTRPTTRFDIACKGEL